MEDKNEKPQKDLRIDCIGIPDQPCDNQFIWTIGEQKFYKEKGLYPPKRCPNCRIKMRKFLGVKKQNE